MKESNVDLRNFIYAGMIVIGITLALVFGLRVNKTNEAVIGGVDFDKAIELSQNVDSQKKEKKTIKSSIKKDDAEKIKKEIPMKSEEKTLSNVNQTQPHQKTLSKKYSSEDIDQFIDEAINLSSSGDILAARNVLNKVIGNDIMPTEFYRLYEILGDFNIRLLNSGKENPDLSQTYVIQSGDTLSDIAVKYSATVPLIKSMNQLSSSTIYAGQKLIVPSGVFSASISKSQHILVLQYNKTFFKFYYVGTGQNDSTPVGDFKIKNKEVEPVWFKNGKIIPYGDPDNLLGTRWMGFDIKGYGIHGTWEPESVGKSSSDGCIRLINEEVEELFSYLPINTLVNITN